MTTKTDVTNKEEKIKMEKKRLGRGLSALLGEKEETSGRSGLEKRETVPIEKIERNPFQPRRTFSEEKLEELSLSIKNQGLLQPILVRPILEKEGYYQIVAGERRWRASMKAGQPEVPVVIREVSDEDLLSLAIVENIQREDLSAIEEAEAYQKLIRKKNLRQNDLAELLGKSRPSIANSLRLLTLSPYIKKMVHEGEISSGHARALVGQENSEAIADRIVREGWNVRQTEDFIRHNKPDKISTSETTSNVFEEEYKRLSENREKEDLEKLLSYLFDCQVSVDLRGVQPILQLRFSSINKMESLINQMKKYLWHEQNR